MASEETPHELIERAHQLLEAGDVRGAERLLQTCREAGDAEWSPLAGLVLGELWLRGSRPMDAIEVLREAIDRWGHPLYGAQAMIALARALSMTGDLDGAEAQLRTVIQIGHPLSELARSSLEELIRWREGVDEENQVQVVSALRQGHELEATGQIMTAVECYRVADDLGSGEGASNLGLHLFSRGEVEDSEAALRRADQRRHPMGTFRLGFLLEETGRVDEAAAVYERAAALGSVLAMGNLATLRQRRGDLDGARAMLERIIQVADPVAAGRARKQLARLDGRVARAIPPPSFDPEASAVDSLLWVAGDPIDGRVQRARAFVLGRLPPSLRGELAALIDAIDRGAVHPAHVSMAPFLQALL